MKTPLNNRHDILAVFDIKDGNPNGDPDAGNSPRIDIETEQGLISDVCIKRKIRNFIDQLNDTNGNEIFVRTGNVLNNCIASTGEKLVKNKKEVTDTETISVVDALCKKYYDIRAFGAVLATGMLKGSVNGQVRGPVQISLSRSIDPIFPISLTMTRNCITDEKERNNRGEEVDNTKGRTMGSKYIIPYGAYVCKISINANDANRTGFDQADFDTFIQALIMMFDNDKSAARSQMAIQRLFMFKHSTAFGDAPSHKLFDSIKIQKKSDVKFPRSFADYDVSIDTEYLKKWNNVELTELV